MTLFEIYKSRKENLATRIRESKSLYETGSVISEVFETMQYQYLNNGENADMSDKLADYINMSKTSFTLLESVSKYKLWENADAKPRKKKSPLPGFIILLAGVALVFITVAIGMYAKHIKPSDIPNFNFYLASVALGCLLILISGFMLFFRRKIKSKATVEISVDADDIVKRLEDVVKNIDAMLERDKKVLVLHKQLMESAINADEAQLFAYLMEAKLSGQGDYALEQLDEVERYLAKQDVIVVKYIKGNEKYFEFLEGEETLTIRPALIRSGEILAKGLVQLKYGETIE